MSCLRFTIPIAALGLLVHGSAAVRAQVSVGVYEDPAGLDCHASPPPPGVIATYYVVARQRVGGIAGVRFAAPVPDCLGATYVDETSPFADRIGDSQGGVTINFGGCITADAILLLSIHVIHAPGAGTTCCLMPVLPDPAEPSGEAMYVSCDLEELPAYARLAWLNEDGTCEIQPAPKNPHPAAFASAVQPPVLLDWQSPLPQWCEEPVYDLQHMVYFGTSTEPPLVADHADPPFDPGPLLPATTYYWRVRAYTGISSATSQLWSFTTATPIATRPSTWGAIKALFR